jgi:hypothetical protein
MRCGLRVVAELAANWGHQDLARSGLPGRAVWFHLASDPHGPWLQLERDGPSA